MPLLTVIMPALNAQSTIGQAVRSTFADLPADAQIAILDDGSTDATSDTAYRAADQAGRLSHLRVIRHDTPQGVAASLNELLESTDSRLVARMDADDITLPGRFTATARALAGGCDFAFTQIIERHPTRLRLNPPVAIRPEDFPIELLVTNPVCHPTMLARRSALDTLGGYRPVPAEDYDLWLRAASHGLRLRRLARWGLAYRIHPGQVSASDQWHGQSWANEDTSQAYSHLATTLTGVPLRRLARIVADPPEARHAAIDAFEAAVTPLVGQVTGPHGLLIRRRLRQRLTWARTASNDLATAVNQRRNHR